MDISSWGWRLPRGTHILFTGPTATRILVHNWSEHKRTFFYAFFNPKVGFNMFAGGILVGFDEMLENLCVRVSKYDARPFHRCIRLSTRVLR
jgi:hypothetical protein